MEEISIEDVLTFWFGTTGEDRTETWFKANPAFDHACQAHFADALRTLGRGIYNGWATSPRGALAWVILADQVSRNVHRGTADAFALDSSARAVAKQAIARGDDRDLAPLERVFLYLPLEHSESLADQDECVRLFADLIEAFPEASRERGREYLMHAEQHRELIRRFGRFPHRNAALGRRSTPEELAYLEAEAQRFGQ